MIIIIIITGNVRSRAACRQVIRVHADLICVQSTYYYCAATAAVICDARVSPAPARAPSSFIYIVTRESLLTSPPKCCSQVRPHTRDRMPHVRRHVLAATLPAPRHRISLAVRSLGNSKPEMAEHLCAGSVKLSPRRHSGRPYAVHSIHTMYTQHAVFGIFALSRPYRIHATPNVNIAYNYFMPGRWALEFLGRFLDISPTFKIFF